MTYGETPYAVWDIIKEYLNVNDRFIDIGSGRGVGVFYLASMVKAKFLGVEFIDEFVCIGNKIAQIAHLKNVLFLQKDLRTYRLPSSDIVFIAGTCFDDDLMKKLCLDLNRVKPKYIFSISTSLIEYGLQNFHVEEVKVYMAWGETSLYILSQFSDKSD